MVTTLVATSYSGISRIRGWLLIVLGSFLSVGMILVASFLASTIANNDRPGGTHWTGSHDFTVKVFELLATVFLFGVVAAGAGIFQLRRGRQSWPIMVILLGLVAVIFLVGHEMMNAAH